MFIFSVSKVNYLGILLWNLGLTSSESSPASQLHVENLFDRKIKTLQSSDAKKFLPHEFQMELQNRGIVCRVSYPHMPQQNGFAKCKHHHIIDVDLTLLAHSHLPMKLWDLSFEMAVFIINCLPFKSPTVRYIS